MIGTLHFFHLDISSSVGGQAQEHLVSIVAGVPIVRDVEPIGMCLAILLFSRSWFNSDGANFRARAMFIPRVQAALPKHCIAIYRQSS